MKGIPTHEDLIDALRAVEGLRDKRKVHPAFHFRSGAFLHFHRDEDDAVYADVRFAAEWEQVPANSPAERQALLDRVEQHIASPRPSRS